MFNAAWLSGFNEFCATHASMEKRTLNDADDDINDTKKTCTMNNAALKG